MSTALVFPDKRVAIDHFLDQYDLNFDTVTLVGRGNENRTYIATTHDGVRYVLRIYRHERRTRSEILDEIDFMGFLRQRGLPVPGLVASRFGVLATEAEIDGRIWRAIMMTFSSGSHPEQFTERLVTEAARLQARLHLLGIEYSRGHHYSHPARTARLLLWAWVKLAGMGLPLGFCHFDYTRNNLFVEDGRIVAVIDFDDLFMGPVVDCLAITCKRELLGRPDLLVTYLDEYQRVRRLGRRERGRLMIRLVVRRPDLVLSKAFWRFVVGKVSA